LRLSKRGQETGKHLSQATGWRQKTKGRKNNRNEDKAKGGHIFMVRKTRKTKNKTVVKKGDLNRLEGKFSTLRERTIRPGLEQKEKGGEGKTVNEIFN